MKPIEIGGFDFKVIYPYIFKERYDLCAQIDRTDEEIRIARKDESGSPYCQHKLEESILHEILHGIDYIYNNDSLTEKQIEGLSMGLHQVLQKNNIYEIFESLKKEG